MGDKKGIGTNTHTKADRGVRLVNRSPGAWEPKGDNVQGSLKLNTLEQVRRLLGGTTRTVNSKGKKTGIVYTPDYRKDRGSDRRRGRQKRVVEKKVATGGLPGRPQRFKKFCGENPRWSRTSNKR